MLRIALSSFAFLVSTVCSAQVVPDSVIERVAQKIRSGEGAEIGYLIARQTIPLTSTVERIAEKLYGQAAKEKLLVISGDRMQHPFSIMELIGGPKGFVQSEVPTFFEQFLLENHETGGIVFVDEADHSAQLFNDRWTDVMLARRHTREAFFANPRTKVDFDTSKIIFIMAAREPFQIKPANHRRPQGLTIGDVIEPENIVFGLPSSGLAMMSRDALKAKIQAACGVELLGENRAPKEL